MREFIDGNWIDAPVRSGKRPGAFCAYTVASHHPYLLLNWTGSNRDVLTLAHELGHGIHAYLARPQGIFAQDTPLTMAETASVFGEAVTNNALLAQLDDPNERFALLASTLEDSIATVFRQVAMSRFEAACHTHRRDVGELSVDDFGNHWADTQTELLGDTVEVTDGYRNWWSYVPHFMATPDTSTPTRLASSWRCRCTPATRPRARPSCPATWTCWPQAARRAPKTWPPWWAAT